MKGSAKGQQTGGLGPSETGKKSFEAPAIDYRPESIDASYFIALKRAYITYMVINGLSPAEHVIEFDEIFEIPDPDQPEVEDNDDDEEPSLEVRTAWKIYEMKKREQLRQLSDNNKVYIAAYGHIYTKCTASMINKLKEYDDYHQIVKQHDLVGLWRNIKDICTRGRCAADNFITLRATAEAQERLNGVRQHKNEDIARFYDRFLEEVAMAESLGVTVTPPARDPNDDIEVAVVKKARDLTLANTFLLRIDRRRYAKVLDELDNITIRNRNEKHMPKTVLKAYQIVSNYRDSTAPRVAEGEGAAFVAKKDQGHKGKQSGQQRPATEGKPAADDASEGKSDKKDNKKCHFCKQPGHFRAECPMLERAAKLLEKQQIKKSSDGDSNNNTDTKKKSSSSKAGKKQQQASYFTCLASDDDEDEDDSEFTAVCCCDESVTTTTEVSLVSDEKVSKGAIIPKSTEVLLDSCSSTNIFCNADLLKEIVPAAKPVKVTGVGKAVISASQVGEVWINGAYLGRAYYHKDAFANLLSMALMDQFHRVDKIGRNLVLTPTRQVGEEAICEPIVFTPRNNLFVHATEESQSTALVATVEGNEKLYTRREVAAAKEAVRLRANLGYPSVSDLTRSIKNGGLLNCPVTVRDVHRAVRIYGQDLAVLKGQTTRKKPEHVPIEVLLEEKAMEFKQLTAAMDIMFVTGVPFLLTVSRGLSLLVTQAVEGRNVGHLKKGVEAIQATYAKHGMKISTWLFDGEKGFLALKHWMESSGMRVNTAAKNEHVPEVERAARQVKERVRGIFNTLPYKLPLIMLVHLVYFAVMTINFFPKKGMVGGGILSPRELVTGQKLDVSRFAKLSFGSYVQVHEDDMVTNTMAPRTLGALSLGPSGNSQGTYKFLNLLTFRVIHRRSWTELPITRDIIELINSYASRDSTAGELPSILLGWDQTEIPDDPDPGGKEHGDPHEAHPTTANTQGPNDAVSATELVGPEHSPPAADDEILFLPDNDNDDAKPAAEPADTGQQQAAVPMTGVDDGAVTGVEANVELTPTTAAEEFGNEEMMLQPAEKDVMNPDDEAKEVVPDEESSRMTLRRHRKPNSKIYNSEYAFANISVERGIRDMGDEAVAAMMKEMDQMVQKDVFTPVHLRDLSEAERKNKIGSIMFMKRKANGTLKARFCADGRNEVVPTGMDTSSPTVMTESLLLTIAADAHERRTVVTIDVEGAFLNTPMGKNVVHVVIAPKVAAILAAAHPEFRSFLNSDGTLVVRLKKALYGCVESAKLFYDDVSSELKKHGFVANPYDACVLNKLDCKTGKQCTVTMHVDDFKVSAEVQGSGGHAIKEVARILTAKYKKINITEGTEFEHLGMHLDYSEPGKCKVHMKKLIEEALQEMPVQGTVTSPANENLFKINEESPMLSKKSKDAFHSMVAKLLYVAKRARPDILLAISFLTTRVLAPTEEDMTKLVRVMKYLQGTKDLTLCIEGSDGMQLRVSIDASFHTHPDGKGHTGVVVLVGKGAVYCRSSKQKMVARSSTEAELIGLTDGLVQVLWARNFLQSQGYTQQAAIIEQDNKSAIILSEKGRSLSARTRHMSVRYFFAKDYIERGEIRVTYTPTEDMVSDLLTKPLMGQAFAKHRRTLLNVDGREVSAVSMVGTIVCSPYRRGVLDEH